MLGFSVDALARGSAYGSGKANAALLVGVLAGALVYAIVGVLAPRGYRSLAGRAAFLAGLVVFALLVS